MEPKKICGFDNLYPLKPELLQLAESYLNEKELSLLPTPKDGQSKERIRMLKPHNLLIRIATTDSERENLIMRLDHMIMVRKVIHDHDLDIKIPKASLQDDYLIEKLLPCIQGTILSTMAYYVLNHRFFTLKVIAFIKLLKLVKIEDIGGS